MQFPGFHPQSGHIFNKHTLRTLVCQGRRWLEDSGGLAPVALGASPPPQLPSDLEDKLSHATGRRDKAPVSESWVSVGPSVATYILTVDISKDPPS